jgi:hypothetical protein
MMTLAAHQGRSDVSAVANRCLAQSLCLMGQSGPARHYSEECLKLYSSNPVDLRCSIDLVGRSIGLWMLSRALWALGFPIQAIRTSAQGLAHAQEMGQAIHLAIALHNESFLGLFTEIASASVRL